MAVKYIYKGRTQTFLFSYHIFYGDSKYGVSTPFFKPYKKVHFIEYTSIDLTYF